jgi:GT2 family glycosyltransferase
MELNKVKIARTFKQSYVNFNDPIDIIIPYFHETGSLSKCVESIIRFCKNINYKIWLVNDGSESESVKFFFKPYENIVKIIDHSVQKGFAASINTGIKNSFALKKVIVHSDCYVDNIGWLNNLYFSFLNLEKQKVGMVCSKTNNSGTKYEELSDRELKNDLILDKPYIPFYSVMFDLNLIKKCGFFKEYPYFGYEDEEFCFRMKKNGFKLGLSGESFINHYGGKTITSFLAKNPKLDKIIQENKDSCKKDIISLMQIK